MRNLLNAKIKSKFDVQLLRGEFHDSMHCFLPDVFEDAIRDTLNECWPDSALQASAFAMACDVAKRRYKYKNKTIIDLTVSAKNKSVTTRSKKVRDKAQQKSDEDSGSDVDVNALFEDSPPVRLTTTNLLIY